MAEVGSLADGALGLARREPRRHGRGQAAHEHPRVAQCDCQGSRPDWCIADGRGENCNKGWCKVSGGYVESSHLRFIRARKGYEDAYDYNVPLAVKPYGYTPGFWGYGGRRHYDRFGNCTKYGVRGYDRGGTDRLEGTVETRKRGSFGLR